jgi:hypothetical protein
VISAYASRSVPARQRGLSLIGLMVWAVGLGIVALVVMKVVPTINEFYTIQRAVDKVAKEGGTTVPDIRQAFDRQKEIEYSIQAISGTDLEITKVNEKIVVAFAYDKEIELMAPVYLVIKYQGRSK